MQSSILKARRNREICKSQSLPSRSSKFVQKDKKCRQIQGESARAEIQINGKNKIF